MLCLFASVLFLIVSENKFVGAFLKKKENKGPDAMKRANLAWMESDSRAAILAARAKKVPISNTWVSRDDWLIHGLVTLMKCFWAITKRHWSRLCVSHFVCLWTPLAIDAFWNHNQPRQALRPKRICVCVCCGTFGAVVDDLSFKHDFTLQVILWGCCLVDSKLRFIVVSGGWLALRSESHPALSSTLCCYEIIIHWPAHSKLRPYSNGVLLSESISEFIHWSVAI